MKTAEPITLPFLETLNEERTVEAGRLTVQTAQKSVSLPLKGVAFDAVVADRIADVKMRQSFVNSYQEPLEAVYIFPLPGGAAVSSFELTVGSRKIRGIVKEREQARSDYRQAMDRGNRAAILEQDRDDVFTVQVGNLPAGEEVHVLLTYSQRLAYLQDGMTEMRLPTVVAPRYIPGTPLEAPEAGDGVESDTDIVGDASRISPPRLTPGFDPQISFSIDVRLVQISGQQLRDLCCSQHAIRNRWNDHAIHVSLSHQHEIMNRDFVLRWSFADETIQSRVIATRSSEGQITGMLSIVPPAEASAHQQPRDVVFVLDRSGSMEGLKMVSANRACSLLLASLNPADRFRILAFDDRVESFPRERVLLGADEAGCQKGQEYLHSIHSRGGTEMFHALGEALETIRTCSADSSRQPVLVLITDGQIGDESRILQRLQTEASNTRVFAVGIDTAVNEAFLQRLASIGRGVASFVEPGSQVEETVRKFAREIGTPLISDLKIEDMGSGFQADSLTPEPLPDLFAGRPLTAFLTLGSTGKLKISGHRNDGSSYQEILQVQEVSLPALAHLWAKSRVMDLEDRYRIDRSGQARWKQEILDIALGHSLLCRFTAFIAVDETEVIHADGSRRKIVQPVSMPSHWNLDLENTGSGIVAHAPMAQMMCMDSSALEEKPFGSPPPPMASSRGGGIIRNAVGKLDSMVQNARKKSREHRNLDNVEESLKSFVKLLKKALTTLKQQVFPETETLELARKALAKELWSLSFEYDVDRLLKCTEKDLFELIQKLNDSSQNVIALEKIVNEHLNHFEDAAREFLQRSRNRKFWESSI